MNRKGQSKGLAVVLLLALGITAVLSIINVWSNFGIDILKFPSFNANRIGFIFTLVLRAVIMPIVAIASVWVIYHIIRDE